MDWGNVKPPKVDINWQSYPDEKPIPFVEYFVIIDDQKVVRASPNQNGEWIFQLLENDGKIPRKFVPIKELINPIRLELICINIQNMPKTTSTIRMPMS